MYVVFQTFLKQGCFAIGEGDVGVVDNSGEECVCGFCGVIVCVCVSFCSFLSKVLYLVVVSLRSFSSIIFCMCGHVLFHMLARDMCRW